jgi:hypothetical protein
VCCFERCKDCGENSLTIGEHIVVPEPEDAKSLFSEKGLSLHVAAIFGVLRAISLDD